MSVHDAILPPETPVWVIEEADNPSSSFYLGPLFSRSGAQITIWTGGGLPAADDLAAATLVFVRYVPWQWVDAIDALRSARPRVIFFMDDDLLDIHASAGLPWRYRFKLARLAAWRVGWLQRHQAQLWVSTPYLKQKYAAWDPVLLPPSPPAREQEAIRVFYHGTASHEAEISWLYPVIEEVLDANPRLTFEVVGGQAVYRMFRRLQRVTVVHPMKWPAYQAMLTMAGREIGLAPMLDSPFNRARSHTKFFDMTRCGAVGIYAAESPYAGVVRHEIEGLLVAMQQARWSEAILSLAADAGLRRRLGQNAQRRMEQLAGEAQAAYQHIVQEQLASAPKGR